MDFIIRYCHMFASFLFAFLNSIYYWVPAYGIEWITIIVVITIIGVGVGKKYEQKKQQDEQFDFGTPLK
ncbi:hypothetical protein P19_0296 [Aeromonas phage P19]|uniref:Holin n=1 Tax=Aeromonas phage vB_AdhaM_G2 TaxID=3238786 RepID=A0AB39TZT2_9CAUD|nr:hypothetical protein P19_0296 [Aeromonas phage P19]